MAIFLLEKIVLYKKVAVKKCTKYWDAWEGEVYMLLDYTEIDERCACGAVHIRTENAWTLSEGPVEKGKRLKLPLSRCCSCLGHPRQLGGFSEESHLSSLVA